MCNQPIILLIIFAWNVGKKILTIFGSYFLKIHLPNWLTMSFKRVFSFKAQFAKSWHLWNKDSWEATFRQSLLAQRQSKLSMASDNHNSDSVFFSFSRKSWDISNEKCFCRYSVKESFSKHLLIKLVSSWLLLSFSNCTLDLRYLLEKKNKGKYIRAMIKMCSYLERRTSRFHPVSISSLGLAASWSIVSDISSHLKVIKIVIASGISLFKTLNLLR